MKYKFILPFTICCYALSACGNANQQPSKETTTQSAPSSMVKTDVANSPQGIALKNLMNQSDCAACHQIDAKSIGPSYVDVANKYDNNEKTIADLAQKIIKGGSGVWGQVPMTEHPTLSKQDAEALVRDIMSLKEVN